MNWHQHCAGRRQPLRVARFDGVVEDDHVVELAALLADAMSADLDEIRTLDVLDWLASSGLTLRPHLNEATLAYGVLLEEVAFADDNDLDEP